jgi:hypothetical protein
MAGVRREDLGGTMGSFDMQPTGPVSDITKTNASAIRKTVLGLKDKMEHLYIEFAEQLYLVVHSTVKGTSLWETWGYDSFEDYAQQELGMKRAKAYYFMQIWKQLHINAGIPKKKLAELNWSKAKELSPLVKQGVLTEENRDEWIHKAKTTSVSKLIEATREAKAGSPVSKEVEKVFRVTYGLYEEQYDNLTKALDIAKVLAESDKPGHLLDLICTDFLAQHAGKHPNKKRALARHAAMVERAFGVKLIIVDDNDEVVHGQQAVDKLES